MRTFNILLAAVIALIAVMFTGINLILTNNKISGSREHRVEIERACYDLSSGGEVSLSDYKYIINIDKAQNISDEFAQGGNSDYIIRKINGIYYRFDYIESGKQNKNELIAVNISMAVFSICILSILLHVKRNILKPFNDIKNIPYELSKGNLTLPLKENKFKYFGRFIWGLDLLRDTMEKQKSDELQLQKEKKTMVLSISHDIKTPLSAIKLYAKALSKNLYTDKNKQLEITENINAKADEIESFVSQIIKASSEDFLRLDVKNDEFYLTELVNKIYSYYSDKLSLNKINFIIEDYDNCLIYGDIERSAEVMQNIIENAVKYGDGHFIKIKFSDEEDCRLITVSNSGCTISENEMPHIFDSFWRGSNTGDENGSGLGLYICRQLMNKMNGEVFACANNKIMNVTMVFRKA